MAGARHRVGLPAAIGLLLAAVALAPPAGARVEFVSATVMVYYGPTCHKQNGSTNCATPAAAGVKVMATTYPGLKRLARGTSGSSGQALYNASLPSTAAFFFDGRVHGLHYEGGWRMTNLQSVVGTIPIDLLLCPSGAWIATLVSVADSCSERGRGVIAYGAPRGAA